MFSLKRRWDNLRNADGARSKLVRSNSFTLQLSPSYFDHGPTASRQVQPSSSESSPEFVHRSKNHERLRPRLRSSSTSAIESPPTAAVGCSASGHHEGQETHTVRYIFDTIISQRPNSLKSLQQPLKEVYLRYMNRHSSSVPGILEILPQGLRVKYAKCDGTDYVEMFNPFHTIAYWAAVKCVVKGRRCHNGKYGLRVGFFPFAENGQPSLLRGSLDSVADSSSSESMLSFDGHDSGATSSASSFLELEDEEHSVNFQHTEHPPLFVCVMRQNGVSRNLKCHVFLCSTVQQAISLASQLFEMLRNNACSVLPSRRQVFSENSTKSLKQQLNERRQYQRHSFDNRKGTSAATATSINKRRKLKLPPMEAKVCTLCNRIKDPATPVHRCGSLSHMMSSLRHLTIKEITGGNQSGSQQHKPKSCQRSLRCHSAKVMKDTDRATKSAVMSKSCRKHTTTPEFQLLKGIRDQFKLSRKKTVGESDVAYRRHHSPFSKSLTTLPSSSRSQWMRLLDEGEIASDTATKTTGKQEEGRKLSDVMVCKRHSSLRTSHESTKRQETKRKKCSKHQERNVTKSLSIAGGRSSKVDRHENRSRCKRCHQCKPNHTSTSSTTTTNKLRAKKDDLEKDSLDTHQMVTSPTECARRQALIGPLSVCPHVSNPQLVFQKIILPKSSGMSLWDKILSQKTVSSATSKSAKKKPQLSGTVSSSKSSKRGGQLKRDEATMKKDAEIVSVLEQIRHGGSGGGCSNALQKDQQSGTTGNVPQKHSEPTTIKADEEPVEMNDKDAWGWNTFLP